MIVDAYRENARFHVEPNCGLHAVKKRLRLYLTATLITLCTICFIISYYTVSFVQLRGTCAFQMNRNMLFMGVASTRSKAVKHVAGVEVESYKHQSTTVS